MNSISCLADSNLHPANGKPALAAIPEALSHLVQLIRTLNQVVLCQSHLALCLWQNPVRSLATPDDKAIVNLVPSAEYSEELGRQLS